MPVEVHKVPDKPIIILSYSGELDSATVRFAFEESLRLGESIDGLIYRISDIRNTEINFLKSVELMRSIKDNRNGSSADPRIHGVFVGNQSLARVYANVMQQFGVKIPFFLTLEEALDYIHLKLSE